MPKQSAGILLYRNINDHLEVFLVHPGGPFFRNKDAGAWSIPKGEFDNDEDALTAARREFLEETGQTIAGEFLALSPVKLKSGKSVHAWAIKGDIDADNITSNSFEMEWPPRSGKKASFPEVDRAGWFNLAEARIKINEAQAALLDQIAVINGI